MDQRILKSGRQVLRPSERARGRCCSGSSARTGAPKQHGRARGLAANSPSAARSPIGSFHPTEVRQRSKRADRRAQPARANPFASAKLLDGRYRFLCEGRICDRSRDGLRLALARDIALPPQLAVHIDETSEVREAKVIWRRGSTIGIRLHAAAPADALRPCDRYALKRRYYAIPD